MGGRLWTDYEINYLKESWGSVSITTIAKKLNRSEAAIKRRIYDLNIPYRPIPLDKKIKWSKEETNKMIELYKKGYDTYAIAKTLDKSHLTISDRLRAQGW